MEWKIIQRKRKYDGHFKVDALVLQHEQFAGGISKELLREQVSRQNSVAVLPYDPKRDEIVLIEQFRVGAVEEKSSPWLIEIIAGLVEEDEDLEQVALRESIEEANCTIENLVHVSSFFPSPGGFAELSHVYIGKTDTSNLGGTHGVAHEGEDIKVLVVSAGKALEMVASGEICSAIPLIALFQFKELRKQLQQEWLN